MDDRCKTCPCLCKRLAAEDEPAGYHFARLTPEAVVGLIEKIACSYKYWELKIKEHERSAGPQLVMQFMPSQQMPGLFELIVIAQSSRSSGGTDLWFRYEVPDECCNHTIVVRELSEMIQYTLDVLTCSNNALSAGLPQSGTN